jgi:hypothetical protein
MLTRTARLKSKASANERKLSIDHFYTGLIGPSIHQFGMVASPCASNLIQKPTPVVMKSWVS